MDKLCYIHLMECCTVKMNKPALSESRITLQNSGYLKK